MLADSLERTFALSFVAMLCIASVIFTLATWDRQAWYGWNLGPDGSTVIAVTPGYPVEKAGIQIGDRVDWVTMPLAVRANAILQQPALTDPPMTIFVTHGSATGPVTLRGKALPVVFELAADLAALAGCLVVGIGIALVLLRPTRMTWGFLLALLPAAVPPVLPSWGQQSANAFAVVNVFLAILYGLQAAGILMFISRFPGDVSRGALEYLDRAALPFGGVVAAIWLYVDVMLLYSPKNPPAYAAIVATEYVIPVAVAACVVIALLTAYHLTKGSDRQRVLPVLTAFCVFVAFNATNGVYLALHPDVPTETLVTILITVTVVALAVAVAHGVAKHRVIDASFVISRTLVYTLLTSLVVAAFVLVDFLSSKVLASFRVAILLEAVVALAFGVWLNALHSRIDRFIDRVFFRRRHLAEERLERAAHVLPHADTADFVDEALVVEPYEALELVSVAVFRLIGDRFERTASIGWEPSHVTSLSSADRIIVHLRAELQEMNLSDISRPESNTPAGLAQPLLSIPIVVRHELLGFVSYSGHRGGEALDPDEIRALRRLTQAAAGAYDHIEAQALRRQIEVVERENEQLRHGEELVREMLDKLRTTTRSVEG